MYILESRMFKFCFLFQASHKRNSEVLSFYTMPEYEAWKESLSGNASGWSIKYYKVPVFKTWI